MWPKDDYQEHMLGYLDIARSEFERFGYSHFQQHDLNEFYTNLDIANECLWKLIGASDVDWEEYRYPLETSCDELVRALRPLPHANSLALSDVSSHRISSLALLGTSVVQREPEIISSTAH